MNKKYGYVRISTKEQNEIRQIIAMHECGIDDKFIFIDKQSGKDFDRPQYKKMLKQLSCGDTLFVHSIDRLGRNYNDIIAQWRYITTVRKADIVVIDMPLLDTRQKTMGLTGTFISDIVLQILSYVAEIEKDNIAKRQAEGIAAAKLNGVRFGRTSIPMPPNFPERYFALKQAGLSNASIAEHFGISLSLLYNWKRKHITNHQK